MLFKLQGLTGTRGHLEVDDDDGCEQRCGRWISLGLARGLRFVVFQPSTKSLQGTQVSEKGTWSA